MQLFFVYDESNEEIYNAFLKYDIEENKETKILQSETFLENTTKKEVFFCRVFSRNKLRKR
jgi:hypothetical protein